MTKPGRNEACHCGSGLKYKKCHLDKDEAAAKVSAPVNLLPRRPGLIDVESVDWEAEGRDDLDDDDEYRFEGGVHDVGPPGETEEQRALRHEAGALCVLAMRLAEAEDFESAESACVALLRRFPEQEMAWATAINTVVTEWGGAGALAFFIRMEEHLAALNVPLSDDALQWRKGHHAVLDEEGAPLFTEVSPEAWVTLRITLEHVQPTIWRRVRVPMRFTLGELHHVIQLAMGWGNQHLHQFTVAKTMYGAPAPEQFDMPAVLDEERVTLARLPARRFTYTYDLGDEWEHAVFMEATTPAPEVMHPVCVEGARACPPEGCGGAWGYEEILESLEHPDGEDARPWEGAGDLKPEVFSAEEATARLKAAFSGAAGKMVSPGKKEKAKGKRR